MSTVSVYVCLPLCENVPSPSLHIAIRNYLFCAERLLFCFFFVFDFSSQNIGAQHDQNDSLLTFLFLFLYPVNFCQCTLLCSTTVLSSVFVLAQNTHRSSWRINVDVLISYSCTLKLHGNHNIFNKLLQKMFFFINKIIIKKKTIVFLHHADG